MINIIYEDKGIIVCEKPPKVPSQSDKTGDMDMVSHLMNYIKENNPNIKVPYIGLVHRLDRPVGGLMVFAKTKEANSKLSEQVRARDMNKRYLAVVCGEIPVKQGELRDYLLKDARTNLSKVVKSTNKDAKEAILEYIVLKTINTDEGPLSLVEIDLKTGRHHQIRVQCSNAGFPLWGDNKYNPMFVNKKGWTQIALWAHELSFENPTTKKHQQFKLNPKNIYPFDIFQKI